VPSADETEAIEPSKPLGNEITTSARGRRGIEMRKVNVAVVCTTGELSAKAMFVELKPKVCTLSVRRMHWAALVSSGLFSRSSWKLVLLPGNGPVRTAVMTSV